MKLPKIEEAVPPACVEQPGHARRKSPKSIEDGTPLEPLMLGVNVSVADAVPDDWFSVRPVVGVTNPVPDPFVLYTMAALAVTAIKKASTVARAVLLALIFRFPFRVDVTPPRVRDSCFF